MPRSFISNIDEANAEVARLDIQMTQVNEAHRLTTDQLTSMTASHETAVGRVTQLEADLTTSRASLTMAQASLTTAQADLATARTEADRRIAAAGIDPAKIKPTSGANGDPAKTELTGLQRAMAANVKHFDANKKVPANW